VHAFAQLREAKKQRHSGNAAIEQAHQEHGAQHDPLIERSKKAAIDEMDTHQAPLVAQLRWLFPRLPELARPDAVLHINARFGLLPE
jgi:hypothetical protein